MVIDFYREKGKVQIVSADNPLIPDPAPNLEEKAMLSSELGQIRQALTELNDDYQNVIIWYYLDDLSISEISQMLGRTDDATRVLLHRALKTLKEKLKEA